MTKSALIIVHLIGIMVFALSQKNDIKILHDTPATMQPGDEAIVNITLDKSDVMGFAKFQITVDDGLSLEAIDAAGASFTFNNQVAKFIWMALPSQRKINLKVRLTAEANALGNLEMHQRFSYIYNNERKNYDAPTHLIITGDDQAVNALALKESIAEKTKNLNAVVSTKRSIESAGINQWRVDLEINKASLSGFAKIEEYIPHGYTAIDMKASGAIFSIDDRDLKYLWYDFPESDKVMVSYKLLPVVAMEAQKPEIEGVFSFLVDEETVEVAIGEAYESQQPEEVATTATDEIPPVQTPSEEALVEETVKDLPEPEAILVAVAEPEEVPAAPAKPEDAGVTQTEAPLEVIYDTPAEEEVPEPELSAEVKPNPTKPSTTAKAYTDGNIVGIPKPEEGIHYRVQLAAGRKVLQKNMFSHLYGFSEHFVLENHEGWVKYTTGYHETYQGARDDRERIRSNYDKFRGPFVAAYNSGERITVQEALMITSQRWVP